VDGDFYLCHNKQHCLALAFIERLRKMEKQKLVYMEAALTLTGLIDEYILNFGFRKRRIGKDGKEIINQTLEKKADMLTEASMIDEWEQDSIVSSVRRTIDAMKVIEYECSGSDLSEYKDRRKNVEKILSIMHIGRTYHDDAIKRLKKLRGISSK